MSLYDMIISRRSIRQFEPRPIPQDVLRDVVNAGRLAPSAANRQPLEFIVVDDEGKKKEIFPCLKWAGYIAPEGNPKPGQEPQAYTPEQAQVSLSAVFQGSGSGSGCI